MLELLVLMDYLVGELLEKVGVEGRFDGQLVKVQWL